MAFRISAFADEAGISASEQIAALRRNNIGLVDVRGIDGVNVSVFTEDAAKGYAEQYLSGGIKVSMIGSPMGKIKLTEDFEEHINMFRRLIGTARIFGTDKIRIFSFFTKDKKEHRAEVLKRLNLLCEITAGEGVTLYHENEKDIYGDVLSSVEDVLDSVKGLKNIFDPANFVQCGQDVAVAIDTLAARTEYLHIKDAIAGSGEIVPAGKGDGKLSLLISRVAQQRAEEQTVLCLEPHLKVFAGYGSIDEHELKNLYSFGSNDEAFDASANALKQLLRELGYRENNQLWTR